MNDQVMFLLILWGGVVTVLAVWAAWMAHLPYLEVKSLRRDVDRLLWVDQPDDLELPQREEPIEVKP